MSTHDPREHARADQLAAGAALFGLDADEQAELDALDLPDDLGLELELLAASVAVAAYEARAEHAGALPASLAAKIIGSAPVTPARVTAARVAPLRAEDRSAPVTPLRRRPASAIAPWLVAAAAVLLAAASWARKPAEIVTVTPPAPADAAPVVTGASQREALLALPGTARVDWKTTKDEAGSQASGDVVWHAGVQKGVMRFAGLAPNDSKRAQYQLWIFDETRGDEPPIDGGVFDIGPSGELLVPFAAKLPVGKAKLFAVTVEKPGGVVVSKRERIVVTATPPAT